MRWSSSTRATVLSLSYWSGSERDNALKLESPLRRAFVTSDTNLNGLFTTPAQWVEGRALVSPDLLGERSQTASKGADD